MRTVGILLLSMMPIIIGADIYISVKKRRDFLITFTRFILFVKNEIRFACRERNEIFLIALRDPEFATPIFEELYNSLKYGKKLENIFIYNKDIRLNPREARAICAFISGLGKNDVTGQLAHCDFYAEQLGKIANEAETAAKTKCRLTVGLSLAAAAALFIIMI